MCFDFYKKENLCFFEGPLIAKPRSEFPELYRARDRCHFTQAVAADAYDRVIAKAREEVPQAKFLVVVCAGWNAENGNLSTSMKEAFAAKQLSLCKTIRDLSQWASLNSAGSVSYQYQSTLKDVPKVLHQTNFARERPLRGRQQQAAQGQASGASSEAAGGGQGR